MEPFLIVILVLLLLVIPIAFIAALAVNRRMTPDRIAATTLLAFLATPWASVIYLQFVPIQKA